VIDRLFIVLQSVFFFARARAHARSRMMKIVLIFGAFASLPINPSYAAKNSKPSLAHDIRSEKLEICLPAIETLVRSQDADSVVLLTQAYQTEKRALVRRYIVDALGLIGSRQGQPTLVNALQDADSQVRQSAVVALRSYGDAGSQQALIDHAQQETNFAVKANLAQALGHSRHRDAVKTLQKLGQDSDPKMRKIAQDELNKRSGKAKK
jgi:HEAT repeat protein